MSGLRVGLPFLFLSLALAVGCGGGSVGTGGTGGSVPPVNNNPVTSATIDGNTLITINAKSNDLVWDSIHGVLYAAISHESPNYPGTIATINPNTGNVSSSMSVSQEPSVLAISDDAQFLYVGIDPTSRTATAGGYVQRYVLSTWAPDIRIQLGLFVSPPDPTYAYYPLALAVAPGQPHTLAVSSGLFRNPPGNGPQFNIAAVYDDQQARPNMLTDGYPISVSSFAWGANAGTIFLVDDTDPASLYTYAVDPSGVSDVTNQAVEMSTPFADPPLALKIIFDNAKGYIYTEQGEVYDPISGKQIIKYSVDGILNLGQLGIFYPDPVLNQIYFVGQTQAQFDGCEPGTQVAPCQGTIASLDKTTGAVLHSITFDSLYNFPVVLTRCGSNGLAFTIGSVRLDGAFPQSNQGLTFILQGPLVAQ